MSAAVEIQKAVFEVLSGALSVPIYDHAPQDETDQDSDFPFVVIGEDRLDAWDTDTEDGFEVEILIHCWSRARGRLEVKQLLGQIYDALHKTKLTLNGYDGLELSYKYTSTFVEPDGYTRQGVISFTLFVGKII
jgi:hypothetical protein